MKRQIVILDGKLANPGDLLWDALKAFGNLTIYDSTDPSDVILRSKSAEILVVNKVQLEESHYDELPDLKLICLLATGYDNVDVQAASRRNITVCNAVGYGSESVAQHVFALLLHHTNQVGIHNTAIQQGIWSAQEWSFSLGALKGLNGKNFGIFGFGKIGQAVARLASAFGMNILVQSRKSELPTNIVHRRVTKSELFTQSDFLSLHIPLTPQTNGIINHGTLSQMKHDAVLINTARGALIIEEDLRQHLIHYPRFTALLDVLGQEPPPEDHPLIGLNNCVLTPHNAWANHDARKKLLEIVAKNIECFLNGEPQNVVLSD